MFPCDACTAAAETGGVHVSHTPALLERHRGGQSLPSPWRRRTPASLSVGPEDQRAERATTERGRKLAINFTGWGERHERKYYDIILT